MGPFPERALKGERGDPPAFCPPSLALGRTLANTKESLSSKGSHSLSHPSSLCMTAVLSHSLTYVKGVCVWDPLRGDLYTAPYNNGKRGQFRSELKRRMCVCKQRFYIFCLSFPFLIFRLSPLSYFCAPLFPSPSLSLFLAHRQFWNPFHFFFQDPHFLLLFLSLFEPLISLSETHLFFLQFCLILQYLQPSFYPSIFEQEMMRAAKYIFKKCCSV